LWIIAGFLLFEQVDFFHALHKLFGAQSKGKGLKQKKHHAPVLVTGAMVLAIM
jgi:hypothetical protein